LSIDSIDVQVEVDPDVIAEDQYRASDVSRADGTLKSAKEYKADAYAALNQFRWEMCGCEHGPGYPVEVYAKAVGRAVRTIEKSVATWAALSPTCSYEDGEHLGMPTPPTPQQVEDHEQQKHVADVGELKAAAIELLATHFKLGTGTIKQNHRPLIDMALARLRDEHPTDDLSIQEATVLLNGIAFVLSNEAKLAQRRERSVQAWMAENRCVDIPTVKLTLVRSMMERITSRMEKYGIAWEDAEEEQRVWDAKRSEAERNINEMARKAQMAILDLQQALASVKLASIAVVTAVRRVEDDGIDLDDDIREIAADDIDHAWAALSLAKAALTGNSGTNWDNELQKLQVED